MRLESWAGLLHSFRVNGPGRPERADSGNRFRLHELRRERAVQGCIDFLTPHALAENGREGHRIGRGPR
jgi:hypothetical protein